MKRSRKAAAAIAATLVSGFFITAAASAAPALDTRYGGAVPAVEWNGAMVAESGPLAAPAATGGATFDLRADRRGAVPALELNGQKVAAAAGAPVHFASATATPAHLLDAAYSAVPSVSPVGPEVAHAGEHQFR
jgi:hypothetical protein